MRLLFLSTAAIALASCNFSASAKKDAGPTVTRDYQVGAFEKIVVAGPIDVKVISDGKSGVSGQGGANFLDETEVVVKDGVLHITPKEHHGIRWTMVEGKASFTVHAGTLAGAVLAGSGNMDLDKVGGDFEGSLAGSGDMKIANVDAGKAEFSIAGSGNIHATAGKAAALEISVLGSGDVDLKGVEAQTAEVTVAGSGNVAAQVRKSAEVTVLGSGDVDISGGAKCENSKHGSGEIRCQ